ncbi:MAG: methionine synthase [Muribaculaceae bacterium]
MGICLPLFEERVLVLDGAMGTMIQRENLRESDFCGERFANWDRELSGCNDVLVLTCPDIIKQIHIKYINAGADIIETNSFNANAVSMADYGLQGVVREINREAGRIARVAVDECGGMKWVAGSVGPTNKSLSLSPEVENPASRSVTWDELVDAYVEQIEGLLEGGVDLLLIETVFDTLNAKAALWAADVAMKNIGRDVPVMLSVTLTESGRTLSGQTIEAFVASVSHVKLFSIGLNCGFGADGMTKWLEVMSGVADTAICVYPNAGLPNEMGEYDESPQMMVEHIKPMIDRGLVNIIGGCCGTTPEHISAIATFVNGCKPRLIPNIEKRLRLSGLEHIDIVKERNFVNIGERCNVAGSRKFLRLINEKSWDEAIAIACKQVEAGAQIVDINMDDAMLDTESEMTHFLNLLASEPDVARVPVMIDSSKWNVIESALKCVQGKGIVNSISLKDGADVFKERAKYIKHMGAAVVVMAFDEIGQADSYERKIEVCHRAYKILTEEVEFNCEDIIFDPNVLALATGIEEHNNYGIDFIRATEWIKNNLRGAKVSGGISNLSFSFRGNNYVREAMHSVFLYHAIAKGMDMAIVNAATMVPYNDVPKSLCEAIENVIFNRNEDSTDQLIAIAEQLKNDGQIVEAQIEDTKQIYTVSEKLMQVIVKGKTDNMEQYLQEAMHETGSAIGVIDGALMAGMNAVGKLFGDGKLFLPQVVKSARVMKQAVAWLNPYIEEEKRNTEQKNAGKMVIATVKGDVHDIGKNIVTVIMRCNGFDVVDLGVMVPGEDIVQRAIDEHADIIALSGLITPSLEEMRHVASLMNERGLTLPLMVGGATTSALHTAVKIAPEYSNGIVVHTRDAALMPQVAQQLINNRENYAKVLKIEQQRLRETLSTPASMYSLTEARNRAYRCDWQAYIPVKPQKLGIRNIGLPISEIRDYINWRPFFATWKFDASMAEVAQITGCDHCRANWLATHSTKDVHKAAEAMQLLKEAKRAIDYLQEVANDSVIARYGFWEANSVVDDIIISTDKGDVVIPTIRQQKADIEETLALSDFISPDKTDYIATFAVTVGEQIQNIIDYKRDKGDDYVAMLYQTVADRLVEAATERFHEIVRQSLWGYSSQEEGNPTKALRQYYQGIRPAVGYPSLPDQSVIFDIDRIMNLSKIGVVITENGAMSPAASVCGIMISHPDSRYFHIGKIAEDQRVDYANRRKATIDEMRRWLSV